MLRVDIYQPVRQRFQFLQSDYAVIHKRPTFAVGIQFTPYNNLRCTLFLVLLYLKDGFNDTFVLAVRDGLAVCPGTHY